MKDFFIRWLFGAASPIMNLVFLTLNQLQDQNVFLKALALARSEVARLDGETKDELVKRQEAYANLRESLQAMGLKLRDSLADLAVSLAVAAARAGWSGKL